MIEQEKNLEIEKQEERDGNNEEQAKIEQYLREKRERERKRDTIKISDATYEDFPEDLKDYLEEQKARIEEINENNELSEYARNRMLSTPICRVFIIEKLLEKREVNIRELFKEFKEKEEDQFSGEHLSESFNGLKAVCENGDMMVWSGFRLEDKLKTQGKRVGLFERELTRIKEGGGTDEQIVLLEGKLEEAKSKMVELEQKLKDRAKKDYGNEG